MVIIDKEVMYVDEIDHNVPFFLAMDIGGTNSNFGIFSLHSADQVLVLSLHYKSKKIENFTEFIKQVVLYLKDRYAIKVESACIGAAGIVYPHRVVVKPTNLTITINVHEIAAATTLKDLFLVNDFEAVALGLGLVDPKLIFSLNKKDGVQLCHANVGFIGAGTGLGKSMFTWDKAGNRYLPVASEGGHADAAFYGPLECALSDSIREMYRADTVSWETILSGEGITKIYRFLGTQREYPYTESTREIEQHNFNPDRISFYAKYDERCRDTFKLYVTFYARCVKNFVLDALALNGVYIAGGIAAKNASLFYDPLFLKEFVRSGAQNKQLKTVPISLIADYNVSLYGAVVAFRLHKAGLL